MTGRDGAPDGSSDASSRTEGRKKRPVQPERRVPAWVVVPLAVLAGYVVSDIPGGIFGLLVGVVLWWSRR